MRRDGWFDLCVTRAAADALAAQLDLDVDDLAICHACLSFVSFAVDSGDAREVTSWTGRMAPDLWAEGLAGPVRMALRRAQERGVANADEAIRLVDEKGGRSAVAHAIVRKLAADLAARAERDLLKMGWQPWPPVLGGG
jgi:hypothetical protein